MKKKLAIIVLAGVLTSAAGGFADSNDDLRAEQLEEWRDTLRFGIESQVIDLLDELESEVVDDLADSVLELLELRTNPRLLRAGLRYFKRIEDPRAESIAARLLTDAELTDEETALEAMRYLSESVEDASTETLEVVRSLLTVQSERLAGQAALTLGTLGDLDSIELLRRTMQQRREVSVRGNIVLAIGRMGEEARQASADWILSVLNDTSVEPTIRHYAADTLGRIGATEARDTLLDLSRSNDDLMRAYAISALIELDAGGLEEELIAALRDDNWRVRQIALEGVGRAGHSAAYEAVRYVARRDPDHRVRSEAIRAIGELGEERGYEFLRKMVKDDGKPFESRALAVDVLFRHDLGPSVATFLSLLEAEANRRNSRIARHVAGSASRAEHDELDDIYEYLLDSDDVSMLISAIRGIGLNRFDRFRDRIEALASDDRPSTIRRHAQEALDRL